MRKLGRCGLAMTAVLALTVAGCQKKAADSSAEGSSSAARVDQNASDEVTPAPPQLPMVGSGQQSPEEARALAAAGAERLAQAAELQAVLSRLSRADTVPGLSGLPLQAGPELYQDLMDRIDVAQTQLQTSREGVANLPNGEAHVQMLGLMEQLVVQMRGQIQRCPKGSPSQSTLAAAQEQLDDLRRWSEQAADQPRASSLRTVLDSAQADLDRAKRQVCVNEKVP